MEIRRFIFQSIRGKVMNLWTLYALQINALIMSYKITKIRMRNTELSSCSSHKWMKITYTANSYKTTTWIRPRISQVQTLIHRTIFFLCVVQLLVQRVCGKFAKYSSRRIRVFCFRMHSLESSSPDFPFVSREQFNVFSELKLAKRQKVLTPSSSSGNEISLVDIHGTFWEVLKTF